MKKIIILFLFLLPVFEILSQTKIEITASTKLINGYSKEIEGENLPYRSSYPEYAKVSLLTRVTDGKKIISWETDPIQETNEKFIYFYWLAGHSSGTSKADRNFDLFINDEKIITFITPMKKNVPFKWEFEGKNKIAVMFDAVKQDAVDDVFGNMYLQIPSHLYPVGKKLKISVVGRNENSPDWYMTFKYSYTEKIDITPIPAIIKKENKLFRAINIKVDHIFEDNTLNVTANNIQQAFKVKKGYNDFDVIIPNNKEEIQLNVSAVIPKTIDKKIQIKLKPAAVREIYLISHSHNDIGYSNLQEEVELIQNKNIDDALRWIEKTKDYPDEAKYKWNIESLWALDNYLRVASKEKKQKLFNAIRSGSIGLSAFYSHNLTGITKPEEFDWLIEYSKKIENEIGYKISNAMITDIPGVNWSIISSFVQNGIKYFSSGQNYFTGTAGGGDRVGHSNYTWGDIPFYWDSPSGNGKVLYWMAGRGYSYFHSFGPGDLFRRGKEHILNYLRELDSTKYPYDMIQLRYSIRGDNGPTDSTLSDFAKQWNEKYFSPKIILSTVESMFHKFEAKYRKQLPTLRGEFAPYWEDGAMSTAYEEMLNRKIADRLVQYTTLTSIINPNLFNYEEAYSIRRNIVLFHEHTWGAWNSISDPDNSFVTKQWEYKKQFVENADKSSLILFNKLRESIEKKSSQFIDVYNTCTWMRNGIVILDKNISSLGNIIIDEKKNVVPIQVLQDGRIAFHAENIPPLGAKRFQIIKSDIKIDEQNYDDNNIDLSIDNTSGSINSLKWKNREYVNGKDFTGLNNSIYVLGTNPNKFSTEKSIEVKVSEDGQLIKSWEIKSILEGCSSLTKNITYLKPLNKILIRNIIDKIAVREKESLHFAFPFAVENPVVRYDIGLTNIQPDKELLPGSNKDYFCVQKWIDVSNENYGITISPLASPLFEVGEMINEDKSTGSKIWKKDFTTSSTIFSYAMNNYWHTNYKADQSGKTDFEFLIQPHNSFNEVDAYKLGAEYQSPLFYVQADEKYEVKKSLFTISSPAVSAESITPDKNSFVIKLFNVTKNSVRCRINWIGYKPVKAAILEGEIQKEIKPDEEISFSPNEIIVLRVFR